MGGRLVRYGASEEQKHYYKSLVARYGSPLLIISRNKLINQYHRLKEFLPGVSLHYAIKAFPHREILRILADQGCHFDVASEGEIELLKPLQVSGRKTIHTHPIKKSSDIKAALRGGSTTFVVDNIDELRKLLIYRNRVGVLLRVSFRSPSARVDLSRKFGCTIEQIEGIVHRARRLGIHIRGLSFHVGSQSLKPDMHVEAIRQCGKLIEQINGEAHHPMNVLDIGGGFPVDYTGLHSAGDSYFAPIREALENLPDDLDLIAEPGRFLVAPAVTGISSVTGLARRGDYQWYYLDDGVYGSYSGQIFDHVHYPLQILSDEPEREPAILSGPTCDSIDIVAEDILLPKLKAGDLVIGHMMGAYTAATSTRFNSLDLAQIVLVD
ncbi:MAG: type III PLP-dependent enzyme [Candidatus Thiodiazotropha sp.]